MKSELLNKLVTEVALDYSNPKKMYQLAREYDRLQQGAAALSYYLRAADFTEGKTFEDKWLQYKCIILGSMIYLRSGDRHHTVEGMFTQAISLLPTRPEAYCFLADYYETKSNWRGVHVYASMGLQYAEANHIDDDLPYPGSSALEYHYASATWKETGNEEGKKLFFDLGHKTILPKNYSDKVWKWIDEIGYPAKLAYEKNELNKFKFPFEGIENIEHNYARHFQDMFVLAALDGKRNGLFVELGSGDPYEFNNTALLEEQFGWKGLSVDNSKRMCYNFSAKRKSSITLADAAQINYAQFFRQNCLDTRVDFLRFNAEHASIMALENMPFDKYEFNVIQFQHNACWWGEEFRTKSREILSKIGYILVANDIAVDKKSNYEDWWLHPNVAQNKKEMFTDKTKTNFVWNYMMKG